MEHAPAQPARGLQALLRNAARPLLQQIAGVKDRGIRMAAVADQGRQQLRRGHGIRHAPFAEARRHIPLRVPCGEPPDIRHAGGRHAVLRRPVRRLAAAGEQRLRRLAQGGIVPAAVPAGAVRAAAEDDRPTVAAQRPCVRFQPVIHACRQDGVLQRDGVGALLMHPREIQSRHVHERVVRRKYHAPGLDRSARGEQRAALDVLDRRALVDRQPVGQRLQELQRMELRLPAQPHAAAYAQRQRGVRLERRVQPERPLRLCLAQQGVLPVVGVEPRVRALQIAVDVLQLDARAAALHGAAVGPRVHRRLFPAEPLDQPGVNGSMLCGELRRRAARLAAPDMPGLCDDDLQAALLQLQRGQNARHPAADHGHVRLRFAVKRRPRRPLARFLPDRLHTLRLPFVFAM